MIIALCGDSEETKEDFEREKERLCLEGHIVLESSALAAYGKIDISQKLFVINKDGKISENTQKEVAYARQQNKVVEYMELERKECRGCPHLYFNKCDDDISLDNGNTFRMSTDSRCMYINVLLENVRICPLEED